MRAFGVAVDVLKTEVLDRLAREPFNEDGSENPQAFRLSDQLSDEFLEQVTNETRRVRFVKNRPEIDFQFEQLRGEHSAPYDAYLHGPMLRG